MIDSVWNDGNGNGKRLACQSGHRLCRGNNERFAACRPTRGSAP
jgi:hypothetical protein